MSETPAPATAAPGPAPPRRLHAPVRPLRTLLMLLVPLLAIVSLLLLLVGLAAAGVRWLLATEEGSAWLLQRLPMVQVQGFQGALLGERWRARSLRVQWGDAAGGGPQWVLIEDLAADGLRWQFRPHDKAWLALQAESLAARKLTLHLAAGAPAQEPPKLPPDLQLPVQLALARLSLDELAQDERTLAHKLDLRGIAFDPRPGAMHRVEQLGGDAFGLVFDGGLRLANAAPYALEAQAALRPLLGADAPAWAAVVRASGRADALDLSATLRGRPLPGREAPQADVRAGLRPLAAWPLASLDARTESLDLAALAAKAPQTRLSGTATLSGGAGQPLVAQANFANAQPGRWNEARLPVSGLTLEVKGSLDRPELLELSRFELALADALRPAGRVKGSAVWQGHDLALEMTLADVTPQRLDGRAAAMTLSGPIAASITGLPSLVAQKDPPPEPAIEWTLDLNGRMERAPQPVRLALEGSANDHEFKIKRARAESGTAVAELTAAVARSGKSDWRIATQGQLRRFDPLPWWPGEASSAWRKGPHELSGDWQLDVRVPADADKLPALALAQRVAGNGNVEIHDSQLAGVPLKASATLAYAPADKAAPATLRADLDIAGNLLAVEGRGDPAGSGEGDRWRLEVKAESLAALAPLMRLDAAAAAWAPKQGSAIVAVNAEGRFPLMRSDGNLRVTQLQTGALSLARAQANWRVSGAGGEQQQLLQFETAGMTWAAAGGRTMRADHLRAEVDGTLAEHRIDISGAMPVLPPAAVEQMLGLPSQTGTRAQFVARGGWVPDPGGVRGSGRYRAQVERAVLGSWDGSAGGAAPAAGWAESREMKAELGFVEGRLTTLQADAGRLRVGDTLAMRWDEVRVDLRGEQPQIQLRMDLEPFALAPLLARWQPGGGWGGDLRLAGRIEVRAAERMEADIVFERRDGDLHLANPDGTQLFGLEEFRLALRVHDGLWNFTPEMRGRSMGEISGSVSAQSVPERRWPRPEDPIAGTLRLDVADIGIWNAWVPPGWRMAGELRGAAVVGGSFGAPRYDGSLDGKRLAVRNLLQGVNVSDGQLSVKLDGDTARIERFTLKGGEGTASITGSGRLFDDAGSGQKAQAELRLKAERFRVLGRADRLVIASGETQMRFLADKAQIDGRFKLDEVHFDASRSDAPTLDEDVHIRRAGDDEGQPMQAAQGKSPYPWFVHIAFDLGDQAHFKGWGLDTGLKGELRLEAEGARPAIKGTINAVNGVYLNRGQKLNIERGIVSFDGPLGNPYLDVLALRPLVNTDNVRVGVTLVGNLLTMRIRLWSDPEMSENDKLAWLLLGRAPDSLGRNEAALLQRAAVALLSGEGEGPTDQLMKALGIDDVSLRSADTDARETVIGFGKRLTQRWYLGYERGVNSTTGTWQLIYRIAQRFTLRMQSGLENSMDVIWTWRFQPTPADASMRKSTLVPP